MTQAGEDEHLLTRNFVLSLCEMKQQGSIPPACGATQMVTMGMRVYLYGGADERQSYGIVHVLEIERQLWKEIETQGFTQPPSRYGHSLLGHSNGYELLVFGGMEPSDLDTSDRHMADFPPPPFASQAPHEQQRRWSHRGNPSDSLYVFNIETSSWSRRTTFGLPPSPRAFHGAALIHRTRGSVDTNRLLIWGGASDSTLIQGSNDLHVLDLETDTWIGNIVQVGEIPSPRCGHRIVYIPSLCCVLLFGGADDGGSLYSLDVAPLLTPVVEALPPSINLLDGSPHDTTDSPGQLQQSVKLTWSLVKASGTPPLSRTFHSCDLVADTRVFVFAGTTVCPSTSDFYIFDLHRNKWTRPLHDGGPINLSSHGSSVLHDKLLIFGGSKTSPLVESCGGTLPALSSSSSSSLCTAPRLSRKLSFLSVLEIKHSMTVGHSRFKLVVVGDSGVGKSCLLQRFVQDVYVDHHVATIGVDFRSVVTMNKGKIVLLQLWDTAGQERFGSMTGNYYRNADGFILVYDSTRTDSYEHILTWIDHIKEYHPFDSRTVKLLIGNKQDLVDQIKVSDNDAKSLADDVGAIFLGTSARTGAGVDTAFMLAAGQLMNARREAATTAEGAQKQPTGDITLDRSINSSNSIFSTGCC